jgi:hypothetical protein
MEPENSAETTHNTSTRYLLQTKKKKKKNKRKANFISKMLKEIEV